MGNKKSFWLVFILCFLVVGKAHPAEEAGSVTLPADAVSLSQATESPTLTDFRVIQEQGVTFATLLANAAFTYTAYRLDSPPSYVVDLAGLVVPPERVESVEVNSPDIKVIRLSQAEGSSPARLVVELNRDAACNLFRNVNGTGVLIRVMGAERSSNIAAAISEQGTPALTVIETVAWPPEEEPLGALSVAYAGSEAAGATGEAPQPVSVAAEIPALTEVPPPSGEVPAVAATGASPLPAVGEQPSTVFLAMAPTPPSLPQGTTEAQPEIYPPEAVSYPALRSTPPEGSSVSLVAAIPSTSIVPPEIPAAAEGYVLPGNVPSPLTAGAPYPMSARPDATHPSSALVKVTLANGSAAGSYVSSLPRPGTVTVDFVNAPLADIFKTFAFQTGQGILVSDNVKGTATLKLEQTLLREAIDIISSLYNLSVREIAGVYLVTAGTGGAAGAPLQSQVYPLRVISAESALSILKEMVPQVKAVSVPEQNGIVLMASDADVRAALSLLEQVDRTGPVTPEGQAWKVFTLQYAGADEVANVIRANIAGVVVSAEPQLRAVTVKGSAGDVAAAERMIEQLDKPVDGVQVVPTAIKIQHVSVSALAAKLQELLPSTKTKISYDETLGTIFISATMADLQAARAIIQAIDVAGAAAEAGGGTEVIIKDLEYATPDEAKAFLEKASPNGDIKVETGKDSDRIIVTFPRGMIGTIKKLVETFDVPPKEVVIEAVVTDMSRELSKSLGFAWDFGGTLGFQMIAPATTVGIGFPNVRRGPFSITTVLSAVQGDAHSKLLARPRIRTVDGKPASILIGERLLFQVATVAGGTVTYALKEERVGINLNILARITSDGHVIATLHPEVSTVIGFNPQGYPIIATRETDSTVLLEDGQTLVIGGLIREDETTSMARVPILSELPILGELFTRRTKTSRPSEVLIFVTPHIVNRGAEL